MTSVRERIEPALSAIKRVVYRKDAGRYRLALEQEPRGGWIDGFLEVTVPREFIERYGARVHTGGGVTTSYVHQYYYAIFDLDHKAGKQLRNQFFKSTTDKQLYDFSPTPSFRVQGTLQGHGVNQNLEWVVLATLK